MRYILDLTTDELSLLKTLLSLYPDMQGTTPENRKSARTLLNYFNNLEVAKTLTSADMDQSKIERK